MSSVPLTDVLPWGDSIPKGGRTILICDSTETDGRFLLHTLTYQCLCQNNKNNTNNNSNNINVSNNTIENNNNKGKVLWIHCGSSTNQDIRTALKKAGCDAKAIGFGIGMNRNNVIDRHNLSSLSSSSSSSSSQLDIINIHQGLSEYYMNSLIVGNNDNRNDNHHDDNDNIMIYKYHNDFIKNIYIQVKDWMKNHYHNHNNETTVLQTTTSSSSAQPLIIIDNVTLLSTQIGPKLTHVLIQKIQSLLLLHNQSRIGCLAISCSYDFDQEYYLNSTQQSKRNTNVTGGKIMQYIGGGGRGILCDSEEMSNLYQKMIFEYVHVWERSLVEMVDGIIDVVPLASGFARDVHGRLVFSENLGSLGWRSSNDNKGDDDDDDMSDNVRNRGKKGVDFSSHYIARTQHGSFSTTTVNFCCHDNGVRAIRLRV